ncbi:MAG: hypothetical protein IJT30_07855 [Muribaculaceae bacterium]|nr:hypothetical protein [Muribaculaceae bacterium]
MTTEETISMLKREFFARRNGVVADVLRRAGDPHDYIMGCQLADLLQVTAAMSCDAALAECLWRDVRHRECRLAAILLHPKGEMTSGTALRWANAVVSHEEADVLCHRQLRHCTCAPTLWRNLLNNATHELTQYTALRLLQGLLAINAEHDREDALNTLNNCQPPFPSTKALLQELKADLAS